MPLTTIAIDDHRFRPNGFALELSKLFDSLSLNRSAALKFRYQPAGPPQKPQKRGFPGVLQPLAGQGLGGNAKPRQATDWAFPRTEMISRGETFWARGEKILNQSVAACSEAGRLTNAPVPKSTVCRRNWPHAALILSPFRWRNFTVTPCRSRISRNSAIALLLGVL